MSGKQSLEITSEFMQNLLTKKLIIKTQTETTNKFVLTCVNSLGLTKDFLKAITELLLSQSITILTIENTTSPSLKAIELSVICTPDLNLEKMKTLMMTCSDTFKVDMALIQDDANRLNKRLIIFDMDSTLIQAEVIDELALEHGIGDKVKSITERAMNGEINFDQSVIERVALLKGLSSAKMDEIYERIEITQGVEEFINKVKSLGYKTAILSGGFRFFAERFKERLGMDYAYANELEIENGVLTGRVVGEILNAQKKVDYMVLIALNEKINMKQVVAIGDGANDLPMLAQAGLGIAFHGKQKVRKEAPHQVSFGSMTTVLYFLGIPGNHL